VPVTFSSFNTDERNSAHDGWRIQVFGGQEHAETDEGKKRGRESFQKTTPAPFSSQAPFFAQNMRLFYQRWPICQTVSGEFPEVQHAIPGAGSQLVSSGTGPQALSPFRLPWSHYVRLLSATPKSLVAVAHHRIWAWLIGLH